MIRKASDITVDHWQIQMPQGFGLAKATIDFVAPDLLILSRFHIRPEDFMNNPLSADEFGQLSDVIALRTAARDSASSCLASAV
jgi:hypothetical protein